MLAELDEQLTQVAPVRALRQLDEREARGERLDVVCALTLRARIQVQIDALPLAEARRKVLELKALIARQEAPARIDPQLSPSDRTIAASSVGPDREVAGTETKIVDPSDNDVALSADDEPPETATLKTAEAVPAARAQVVDFMSYRTAGHVAQSERASLQSSGELAEPKLPWWLEAARPKARVRVPARTYQVLASTAMALAFWIVLPPMTIRPSPLTAVQMAAGQFGEMLQVGSMIEALRQTDVAPVLYSR